MLHTNWMRVLHFLLSNELADGLINKEAERGAGTGSGVSYSGSIATAILLCSLIINQIHFS
jgi:hypothetical protein